MASVVRALLKQERSYYVDIGNWTMANGRQDELKAEALAQVFRTLNPTYLNVGPYEARLGPAYLRTLNEIAGGALDSSNLRDSSLSNQKGKQIGSLWIQGVAYAPGFSTTPAEEITNEAAPPGTIRVVLFSGDRTKAQALATNEPVLFIYSLQGDPPKVVTKTVAATFVTPGDRGHFVGKIELIDGEWRNLTLIELGPEKPDDKLAIEAYRQYLRRVSEENLLADLPRTAGKAKFVGSAKCISCHAKAYSVWKISAHAHALATLRKTGNHIDPECVGCHVVGLRDTSGFRDVATTPKLANVGCESCHGAASNHILWPKKRPYGKAGERSCLPCHTPDNSPHFKFAQYWKKVKH